MFRGLHFRRWKFSFARPIINLDRLGATVEKEDEIRTLYTRVQRNVYANVGQGSSVHLRLIERVMSYNYGFF